MFKVVSPCLVGTVFWGTCFCQILFPIAAASAQQIDRHLKGTVDDKDQAIRLLHQEGQMFAEKMANEGRGLKEAADFVWVPGLIMQQIQSGANPPLFPVFDSDTAYLKLLTEKPIAGQHVPVASGPEQGIELDYVVSVRIIGRGCANVGFVRYQISDSKMRFEHLWSEPMFEVTAYPALAFDLTGIFNSSTQTAHLHDYFKKRITQKQELSEAVLPKSLSKVSSFSRYALKDLAAFPLFAQPQRVAAGDGSPSAKRTNANPISFDQLILRTNETQQIVEAIRRRDDSTLDQTSYGYEDGKLKRMGTIIAPRKVRHKVSLDMRTVLREAKGLRGYGGLNPDLMVDPDVRRFQMTEAMIESPPGGRLAEIDFQTTDLGGTPTTVASEIRFNCGTVDVKRIQTICCARLIGVRRLTSPFDDLKINNHTGNMSPTQDAYFTLSTAWGNRFQGADANAAMESILSTIGPKAVRSDTDGNSSRNKDIELMAAASMHLLSKVYRREPKETAIALKEWMSQAVVLKLEPWIPELLNTLLSAAGHQGDQETYEEIMTVSGKLIAENPHPEILDSLTNSRTQTRAPAALWAISEDYFAANPVSLPERQMRRVFLKASLLPSLRRELAMEVIPIEENNSAYSSPDIVFAHRAFSTSKLASIGRALKEEANNVFDQLSSAQRADWSRDLQAIHAWVGR